MSIRYFVAFFGILLLGSYPGRSAVTDLRITEVDPLGDWVEITHFSDMAFVNGATRGFCKRFNYANSINIGESFGARESKTFNISLHDTLSDVWLYVGTAGFGIAANMITGMKTIGSNKVGLLTTLKTPLRQTAIAIDKEIPLATLGNVCALMVAPVSYAKS